MISAADPIEAILRGRLETSKLRLLDVTSSYQFPVSVPVSFGERRPPKWKIIERQPGRGEFRYTGRKFTIFLGGKTERLKDVYYDLRVGDIGGGFGANGNFAMHKYSMAMVLPMCKRFPPRR